MSWMAHARLIVCGYPRGMGVAVEAAAVAALKLAHNAPNRLDLVRTGPESLFSQSFRSSNPCHFRSWRRFAGALIHGYHGFVNFS